MSDQHDATGAIRVTDEMVEAAMKTMWPEGEMDLLDAWRDDMRAALTAALALVPPVPGFRAGAEWAARIAETHLPGVTEAGEDGEVFIVRRILADIRTALAALPEGGDGWTCAARKQGTAGGNDPADCNWPVCGCDPYADKVIVALQESGNLPYDGSPPSTQGGGT